MAEVIQFPCPVCGTQLRLPLELAARQGPCPCCQREIVAPDPYRGIGAHEPPPPPTVPAFIEPSIPFADSPPVAAPLAETSAPSHHEFPAPSGHDAPKPADAAVSPAAPATSHTAILVLSVLLTAVVSLVAGFLLGLRSNRLADQIPPPTIRARQAPLPPVLETPTKTVLVKPPVVEPTPEPAPAAKPDPVKTSAAAEAALKAFLDAPDWSTRNAHALQPERVRGAMETYSHQTADGPTAYRSIQVRDSVIDRKTGGTHFIFLVTTDKQPKGFPVVVSETRTGWQVDWESFVEFRDNHFDSFAEGPAGKSGTFHLIVGPAPSPHSEQTENEYFTSFLLQSPVGDLQRVAYVRKTAGYLSKLSAATANGAAVFPILQVTKSNTPDGKTYLEITGFVSGTWLPEQAE